MPSCGKRCRSASGIVRYSQWRSSRLSPTSCPPHTPVAPPGSTMADRVGRTAIQPPCRPGAMTIGSSIMLASQSCRSGGPDRDPARAREVEGGEMRLATRMQRLGTETAFEVLVRARALEAQGRDVIHLEIGEPDFDTPANVSEAGVAAIRDGLDPLWPRVGAARPATDHRRLHQPLARNVVRPGKCRRDARRQADHVLPDPGAAGGRRRRHLPRSRVPDLPQHDRLRRRASHSAADPRGA